MDLHIDEADRKLPAYVHEHHTATGDLLPVKAAEVGPTWA